MKVFVVRNRVIEDIVGVSATADGAGRLVTDDMIWWKDHDLSLALDDYEIEHLEVEDAPQA